MTRLPRVLVLNGEPGPSYKLVAQWPFAALEAQGHCEVHSVQPEDLRVLAYVMWCDVMFVVRGFTPNAALAVRLARRLRRFVVAYWDDNIFEVPRPRHAEPVIYEYPDNHRSIVEILRSANTLAVANPRLINILRRYASSTIPGITLCVPAVGLTKEDLKHPRYQCRSSTTVIGFAGNRVHKSVVQDLVVPALDQLQREGWQFRLQVIGPRIDVPEGLCGTIEHKESMRFDEWIRYRESLNWTIALAPLPDSDFHASKFQNKFLEYAALGAPGIYSNVPPYSEVIFHERTGLLADNTISAWAEAIRKLLANPDLRERIIEESWYVVAHEHSMDAVCESYKSELQPAFAFRRPSLLTDPRAVFDVTRWYLSSIVKRIARLIRIRWREICKRERKLQDA